jgi:hypothetical protein
MTLLIGGLMMVLAFGGGYWFRSLSDEKWPDNNARPDQSWGW